MTITTSTRKNVNERSLDVISNLDLYVSAIGCQFLRRDKKIFFDSVKSRLNSVSSVSINIHHHHSSCTGRVTIGYCTSDNLAIRSSLNRFMIFSRHAFLSLIVFFYFSVICERVTALSNNAYKAPSQGAFRSPRQVRYDEAREIRILEGK